MTAVGKILVFLNLVFSLVVGAFVVMIYLSRVHWAESYEALKKQNEVLAANAKTYQGDAFTAKQNADAQVNKAQGELQKVQKDNELLKNNNEELQKQVSDLKKNNTVHSSLASAASIEGNKRQEDVAMLRETLQKEQEQNNKLVKEAADAKSEATVANIERQSVQDQNNRLEARLQQAMKDMAQMRARGGSTTPTRGANEKNPPPESVEGLVKQVDPSGLMTTTIGSDSGLTKGHTLELFRLNPSAPTRSKYLGTVRVLEASPKEAVVQPVGRLADKPRVGDQVASRILGGG